MSKNQLVICYSVDDINYSEDIWQPFEYESKIKAKSDLLAICEEYLGSNTKGTVKFAGIEIDPNDFSYYHQDKKRKKLVRKYKGPVILTLSEWWEAKRPKP